MGDDGLTAIVQMGRKGFERGHSVHGNRASLQRAKKSKQRMIDKHRLIADTIKGETLRR